jgi:hypothetical protein
VDNNIESLLVIIPAGKYIISTLAYVIRFVLSTCWYQQLLHAGRLAGVF